MSVGANGGVVSNCSHGGVFCGSRRRLHLSYVVSLCYDRGIDVGSQFTICQFMLLGDTSRRRRLSNCVLRECVRRRALGARAAQIPRRCSGVAVRVGDDMTGGRESFRRWPSGKLFLGRWLDLPKTIVSDGRFSGISRGHSRSGMRGIPIIAIGRSVSL